MSDVEELCQRYWREQRDLNLPSWPDTNVDHQAWARAKQELPQGTLSEIAQRAQKIKEELCSTTPTASRD